MGARQELSKPCYLLTILQPSAFTDIPFTVALINNTYKGDIILRSVDYEYHPVTWQRDNVTRKWIEFSQLSVDTIRYNFPPMGRLIGDTMYPNIHSIFQGSTAYNQLD